MDSYNFNIKLLGNLTDDFVLKKTTKKPFSTSKNYAYLHTSLDFRRHPILAA